MDLLKVLVRHPILVFRKSRQDDLLLKASALAFISILSLVPLFAAFSFMGEGLFNQSKVLEFLTNLLPYSEETITEELDNLLLKAKEIQGAGLLWFLGVSLFAFANIEATLNTIWNVSGRRRLRERILSFTLILFWGPILIGAAITSLIFLSELPFIAPLDQRSRLFEVVPFLTTLVGLTMLYWLAPYAPVRFKNALAGASIAALLLEVLRRGFGLYVQGVGDQVNVLYGGFGLVLFFMISIELTWAIVLLGCELSFVTQNFATLLRIQGRPNPPHRLWVALASLSLVATRFYQREPITSRQTLAEELGMPPDRVEEVLKPLIEENYLRPAGGDEDGYLLAGDPGDLRLDGVVRLYDAPSGGLLKELPPALGRPLNRLHTEVLSAGLETVGQMSLAELVRPEEEPEATQRAVD